MKIEEILNRAYESNASDIHMLPGCPLMFRMNGKIVPQEGKDVQESDMESLLQEILTEEQTQELEQEGEVELAVSIADIFRVRINIYRQRGTYAAAMHMIAAKIPNPEELGIPKSILELTKEEKGLILITGEAGSGKTTTLASLLQLIAERDSRHIITIENPIEYLLPHGKSIVSQREIGSDTSSYAKAARAALRQDPDVLFIGELSDMETVEEAIAAAKSGRLVLSTLYTNRTEDTLSRLIDIFPVHKRQQIRIQLAEVLKGIIAQQLLPRSDMEGRNAVFEIMLSDKEIINHIREDRLSLISTVMEAKRGSGMQTMDDAVLSAFMKSRISAETAVAYALDTELMANKIRIYN